MPAKSSRLLALSDAAFSGKRAPMSAAAPIIGSPPPATTARCWFTTAEAFEQLCVHARGRAEAGRSDFDRQLAAEARFKQLRHGLDAALRATELQHLCRIVGMQLPAPPATRASIAGLLEELDTPLLHSMRVGYIRVATREALRTAALIREELAARGEVLP